VKEMDILEQLIAVVQQIRWHSSIPIGANTPLDDLLDSTGCMVLAAEIQERFGLTEFDLRNKTPDEKLKTLGVMAAEIQKAILR
jgi:acyl carrier protein